MLTPRKLPVNRRYRIIRPLGEGGMGSVYLARDLFEGDREIALKILRRDAVDPEAIRRFRDEFSSMTRLRHPNLVEVHDFGALEDDGGQPFLTMEYVPGGDLTAFGWPELRERFDDLATQCLRAFDYIHCRGLLHNDIKPQNILVRAPFQVKIVDFGLAQQQADPALPGLSGTLHYIAPERLEGALPAAQSDLFSLGVVLYERLAGRLPYDEAGSDRLVNAILQGNVRPPRQLNPEIPERLQAFVMALLARRPEDRPVSAGAALDLLSTGAPVPLLLDTPETHASFVTSGRLVGRERAIEELDRITTAHLAAPDSDEGAPRVLLLTGPGGIGKSRLLRELKHRLQLSGTRNLTGRCYEEGGVPFQPFVELLRQLPRPADLTSEQARVLDQVLGAEPGTTGEAREGGAKGARTGKMEFLGNLASCLDRLAGSAPGVLLIEDLHWGDAPGIGLLEHLLGRSSRSPWLVVATLGDDEARDGPAGSLLKRAADRTHLHRLALDPLTHDQVTDLLASMVPFEEEPAGLAGLLVERTGGNPLYIEELMKTLAAEGALRRRGSAWHADAGSLEDLGLPPSLTAVVVKRIASLDRPERSVARTLSIINRPVSLTLLERAMGDTTGNGSTSEPVEALERLRLVSIDTSPEGTPLIALAHGQVREAIYQDLSEPDRRDMHLRVGEAIETAHQTSLNDVVEELAHHFHAAGERERAIDYSLRAGAKAATLFNPLRRLEFLRQAFELMPPGDTGRRLPTLSSISAIASTDLGDHATTMHYSPLFEEEARRAGDRLEEARALRDQSWAMSFLGEDRQAIDLASRALGMVRAGGDRDEIAMSLNYMGLTHARQGKHREALPHFEEATSIYRSSGNPETLAMVLNNAALCHLGLGEPDVALRLIEEVLAITREHGLRYQYHRYLSNLGLVRLDLGDLTGAIQVGEEAIAWTREHESLEAAGHQLITLGLLYTMRGRFDLAVGALEEARRIRQELGDEAGQMMLLDYLGNCRREIGRPDRAEETHQEGYDLARRLGVRVQEGHLLASLAADSLARGATDTADERAREALSIARELGHPRIAHIANCTLARVAARRGDRRAGNTVSRRIVRQDRRSLRSYDRLEGNLALARLALASGDTAAVERETRAGLDLAEKGGFREYQWRFRALLGESLGRQGISPGARKAYNEAHVVIRQVASEIEDAVMRQDYQNDPVRREVARAASGGETAPGVDEAASTASSHTPAKMLETIYEITQVINSILDPGELMNKVMDLAIENVSAERGLIFLYLPETDEMEMVVARNVEAQTTEDAIAYSHGILKDAWRGRSVLSHDAGVDERFRAYKSVATLHIHSLMCVPLRLKSRIIGTVYVDTRKAGTIFTQDDLRFLEAFANQSAIAIENARLFDRVRQENRYLKQAVQERYGYHNIVGRSAAMREVFDLLARIGDSTLPVMIRGESGTGKELVAKAIHHNSPRREQRFYGENCAALTETLLESELFGHVKGAFTGAETTHKGLFELADRGTLFLDEIGDMSVAMQSKLLRVLQDGEIRPVGSETSRRVDVRIISATNRNLEAMIKERAFREDLYFRLKVIVVTLPPLRDRREDIPLLVDHFLSRLARDNNAPKLSVEPGLIALLSRHHWPGNVRELENQVYRLAVFASGDTLTLEDARNDAEFTRMMAARTGPRGSEKGMTGEDITRALSEAGGDRVKAARLLGISRATLFRKMRQFQTGGSHPRPPRRAPAH